MLRGVGAALAGGAALGNPHSASALIGGAYVSQAEMAARGLVGLTVGDTSMLKQRSGMCTGTLIGDGFSDRSSLRHQPGRAAARARRVFE